MTVVFNNQYKTTQVPVCIVLVDIPCFRIFVLLDILFEDNHRYRQAKVLCCSNPCIHKATLLATDTPPISNIYKLTETQHLLL